MALSSHNKRLLRLLGLIASVSLGLIGRASAHSGPPYPVVPEAHAGACKVSVWADPDVGDGKIFVIPEVEADCAALPEVSVVTRPVSNRLPERSYRAAPQRDSDKLMYLAIVPFDRAEPWTVEAQMRRAPSSAPILQARAIVEVTPDGVPGPVTALAYALPFLGIAVLWAMAAAKRRRELPKSSPC